MFRDANVLLPPLMMMMMMLLLLLYRGPFDLWLHQEYHRGPTPREMQYDSKHSISVADDRKRPAAPSAALPPSARFSISVVIRLLLLNIGSLRSREGERR